MLIMLHLDPADSRAGRAFRLQVKERLYRFNYVRSLPFVSTYFGLPLYFLPGNSRSARERRASGEARRDIPERAGRLLADIGYDSLMRVIDLVAFPNVALMFAV